MINYLNTVEGGLCDVCLDRKDRNPLRVLDCKVPSCKEAVREAPKMVDFLCEECSQHYSKLKEYFSSEGLVVDWIEDSREFFDLLEVSCYDVIVVDPKRS